MVFLTPLLCLFQPDAPTLKVLHLSDFHWDPEYLPGSNADCGDPLCCRAGSGIPANESAIAGYWGDYRDCDLPLWTLRNSMEHIASTHSVSLLLKICNL